MSEEALSKLSEKIPVVKVSAMTGEGIDELKQAIHQRIIAEAHTNIEDAIITNERHYSALEQSLTALCQARRI